MTLKELDSLLEDAQKQPHVADRVQQYIAIAAIEIARQLTILNEKFAAADKPNVKAKSARAGR